jgi:IS30 family transposase
MARLTKHQWLEAEELYKQGWTQREIGKKFGVRPETVSVHMNRHKIKGGENIDVVKQEMEIHLQRKLREFMEKKANRQIDTKEKFHTLINTTLAFFIKDIKAAQDSGVGLDKIAGSARSLKEAVQALKIAREELYTILDIQPDVGIEDAPDLFVMTMSPEDEDAIRGSGKLSDDDEELLELEEGAIEMENVVRPEPNEEPDDSDQVG